MAKTPWWQAIPLREMTGGQWESLCDGCGKCCLGSLDFDGHIVRLARSCRHLDTQTCRCRIYPRGFATVKGCRKITPAEIYGDLPETCAYRLLGEGKGLYWWHHLVSGSRETVHEAGISVRGRVGPESLGVLE